MPIWLSCADDCPSEGGNDTDSCASVESASYKIDYNGAAPVPPILAVLVHMLIRPDESQYPSETVALDAPSLANLAVTWQFTYRAALPPRAPSLLS